MGCEEWDGWGKEVKYFCLLFGVPDHQDDDDNDDMGTQNSKKVTKMLSSKSTKKCWESKSVSLILTTLFSWAPFDS